MLTQQYQQINTWFLQPDFDENYTHFSDEIPDLNDETDNFSYITQEFETDSLTSEDDPAEPFTLDFQLLHLYFEHRLTAPAA